MGEDLPEEAEIQYIVIERSSWGMELEDLTERGSAKAGNGETMGRQ